MGNDGFGVEPGKVNAVGSAYGKEGDELVSHSSKIESDVAASNVGKAWTDFASPYVEAFGLYRDVTLSYGKATIEFGGQLESASKNYEKGEDVNKESFSGMEASGGV